jgi:hypothetical protein
LFANDDIAFEGPLYPLIGKALSDRVVGVHRLLEPLIILLVLAHLAAIAFYVRFKKEVLIMPMITGMKESAGTPATGGGIIAFCLALAVALGAVYGASGIWLPDSVAPPAGSAPAW